MARIASTMQEVPLTIGMIMRHGARVHGTSAKVLTYEGDSVRSATFSKVATRAARLAGALRALGVEEGDRVATFSWNNQEHLECYLAIPSMGAVIHTLNIRLFPEQLAYVVEHGQDKVVIFDSSLAPLLARVPEALAKVEHLVAVGDADLSVLAPFGSCHRYEELLVAQTSEYDWPEIDESDAAAMCYTSGTTGNPKGVVYSHRSTFLHSMAVTSASGGIGISESDRALPIVPMFHVNAWGIPYGAWMAGADLLMPGQFLQAPHLAKMIAEQRPTLAAGVPTIWNDLLAYAIENNSDLSSLRRITAGGSAVPRSLIEGFEARLGVPIIQAWGMTETSPLYAVATPPKNTPPDEEMGYRAKTGRVVPGVEIRIAGEGGQILPNDGDAVGEFEVRGPWITGSYFEEPSPERFHDGWLRTGDVGTLDSEGFMQITDRTKDVIKSGGEWISSVELENLIMAHPEVHEAAVVAVPDERWQERPLACVVRKPGSTVTADELVEFLRPQVAKWWLPERWTFVEEIPRTSVGKFDKKVVRAEFADRKLDVVEVEPE